MRVVDDFPRRVVETGDAGIAMPDGVRLSARIWMPEDAATDPVPAVLEYIPYRKRDGTAARDALMHPYMAGHGYACVRVDLRGSGESEGHLEDEYLPQELDDACAVIAWLAAQPWCTGAVGMMGKSWGGFNALQTAFLEPPALKAVIAVCASVDRFGQDIHYKGGCLLGENFGWGAVMLSYSSRPPDPMLRADWREAWLARLAALPHLAPRWAGHPARDAYWQHGSVGEDFSRLTVPVLSIGGWADNYMNAVGALVAEAPLAKGIVGPWVHQYPHSAVPGPRIGFLQEALRWWDRWLKGIPNGAEDDPPYRALLQHSAPPDASAPMRAGHWVTEDSWPGSRVKMQTLILTDAGLGVDGPPPLRRIRTDQRLGLASGEFFPMGLNAEMAGDQRGDDALSVCFDTKPLVADTDLLGAAVLRLTLACDRTRGLVAVRLCDVAPDGTSVRLAHGMLNLCHRDGMDCPRAVVPGAAMEIAVTLDQMAARVAAGHRLRIALSTTYWPFLWPSPEVATLTLSAGTLDLPVHSGSTVGEWQFPPPETAPPLGLRLIEPGHASRRVERDLVSGAQVLVVEDYTGLVENPEHGLITGDSLREVWRIEPDDPLSASVDIVWEQRLSRGDWAVHTRVAARMSGTVEAWRMEAEVTAWEGDEIVFSHRLDEDVPRPFG